MHPEHVVYKLEEQRSGCSDFPESETIKSVANKCRNEMKQKTKEVVDRTDAIVRLCTINNNVCSLGKANHFRI